MYTQRGNIVIAIILVAITIYVVLFVIQSSIITIAYQKTTPVSTVKFLRAWNYSQTGLHHINEGIKEIVGGGNASGIGNLSNGKYGVIDVPRKAIQTIKSENVQLVKITTKSPFEPKEM